MPYYPVEIRFEPIRAPLQINFSKMHQLFGIGSNFGRIADFETLEGSRVLDLGKVSPGAQVVSTLGSIAIIDFIQQGKHPKRLRVSLIFVVIKIFV